ncbi:hypothetical protein VFPBJ_06174 [Purpureocillium lilacinum]|uniref:Uncharacterized protein n=1 Tax=Purpureocillium lilacinum TaxID=33203 RepID=A0A179GTW2_PURLI|nr:hypothetical protein VFPBJ_06174 [Purpureocillium lilacinum]
MRHHHHSPLTTHQPPRPLATSYVVTTTTSGHHKRPPRKKFPEYPSREPCVHAVTLPVPIDFGPWHAGHVPDQMGILRRRHAPPVRTTVGRAAVEGGEFRIRP